jgi:hypothetical protein
MGSAVIFSGTKVKTLKSTIDLGGGNDIISSTVDPTSSATSANPGSLLLNSSTGKLYRKNDSGSSTNWTEVGASGQAGINYILNPDAANGTTGWSTYKETDSVTFQDAGDTVTLNNHGIAAGTAISFTSITSTTGISTNTLYYVVNPTTNTFQVATSVGGSALALTTNGSGTMVRSIPKTGSGGSPNVTWTRDTTTPLRGSADFNFTKGAANYMGEGVAYSFTIDNADIAKPLSVTFDYELLSGTYTTGDLTVYLIADPSGTPVIIQPAGYQIQSATASTKMRHIATFQTQASGTSYRLVVQVATVSASAYTFALDTIAVGPEYASYGCPVTDWQSYTPTVTGSTSNPTVTASGKWRRVGDSAEILMKVSGTANGSGYYTFSLPSGMSIDTTKVDLTTTITDSAGGTNNFGTLLGSYSGYVRGGVFYTLGGVFSSLLSTSIILVRPQHNVNTDLSFERANVEGSADSPFTGGFTYDAQLKVPITGWSSNVVMSSDAATNVVALYASGATNNISASSVVTVLQIGSAAIDTNGGWTSGSSANYTITVPGTYSITIACSLVSTITGLFRVGYGLNSSSVMTEISATTNPTQYSYSLGTILLKLNAGDKIYPLATQNTAGAVGISSAYIKIERLSGPAQIAATDTVAAAYTNSTSTTGTNNAFNVVKYSTKVYDTTNGYDTSTGSYTVPVSGKYRITGSINAQITPLTVGNTLYCVVMKNSTSTALNGSGTSAVSTSAVYYTTQFTATVSCVAGDILYIGVNNAMNTTNSISLNNDARYVYFSVERVGN